MVVLRELVLKCLQFNIVLRAEHIPGAMNIFADALSRLQVEKFMRLVPQADPAPTDIPAQLFRIFSEAYSSC